MGKYDDMRFGEICNNCGEVKVTRPTLVWWEETQCPHCGHIPPHEEGMTVVPANEKPPT